MSSPYDLIAVALAMIAVFLLWCAWLLAQYPRIRK
jgi:hypothetical protein